jgi:hypothetical protein
LYDIFNIYDNVVSLYNFSLYTTIRVYGHFGPGLDQFLGLPLAGMLKDEASNVNFTVNDHEYNQG